LMRDDNSPSPTGDNGERDSSGRFTAGNTAAKGNPYAKRVAAFRQALMDSVSVEDIADIARALVDKAKGGDTVSARIVLDRLLGKPEALDILTRIEALEERMKT